MLVDVDEVQEHLQQVLVVVVAMPALRGDALRLGGLRHRVPDVDVLELRPHLEVRVRDVEQAARGDGAEPRVVEPELGAVAVEAHDELLAGANADVLAALREVGLGLGDEAVAHRLERRASAPSSAKSSPNDATAKPLASTSREDAPLHLVELRAVGLVERAALPVREHAVVELVRRADAAPLDRLRDAVCAVREHAVHAA